MSKSRVRVGRVMAWILLTALTAHCAGCALAAGVVASNVLDGPCPAICPQVISPQDFATSGEVTISAGSGSMTLPITSRMDPSKLGCSATIGPETLQGSARDRTHRLTVHLGCAHLEPGGEIVSMNFKLGDPDKWREGELTPSIESDTLSPHGQCDSLNALPVRLTVTHAVGGAAPWPAVVTSDYERQLTVEIDLAPDAVHYAYHGTNCPPPRKLHLKASFKETEAEFVRNLKNPCFCG